MCLAAEAQLQDLEQLESAGDVYGFGGELTLFWSAACWRGAAAISTCRELIWTRRVIIVWIGSDCATTGSQVASRMVPVSDVKFGCFIV